jgi:hypothetical protein
MNDSVIVNWPMIRRAGGTGLVIGALLVFALVLALGSQLHSAHGTLTEHVLFLTVLSASKIESAAGVSHVTLVPDWGMLVPALAPSALCAGAAAILRRRLAR